MRLMSSYSVPAIRLNTLLADCAMHLELLDAAVPAPVGPARNMVVPKSVAKPSHLPGWTLQPGHVQPGGAHTVLGDCTMSTYEAMASDRIVYR